MNAGRVLDELIEKTVMGPKPPGCMCGTGEWCRRCSFFTLRFSSDISDAWLVVEALTGFREAKDSMQFDLVALPYTNSFSQRKFKAKFSFGGGKFEAFAEGAPLAICLAALKACGLVV